MRSARLGLAVLMGVLLTGVAAASAQAAIRLGVVDIVKVTNEYERTKDANADLQNEMQALKSQTEAKVKPVQDLQIRRDAFNKGTAEWRAADDKALQAEVEVRAWSALEQAKIERRHRDVLLDMYHQISAVVLQVSKEKGCDLVFTKAFLAPPQINLDEATGLEDLKSRIMNQRVLYPTDAVDFTDDVLKIMNANYKSAKKSLGGEAAPAVAPAVAPVRKG